MIRLPLAHLQEAKTNPELYKQKLRSTSEKQPRNYGYFNVLRDTVLKYHASSENIVLTRSYLEEKLDKFKNQRRCQAVVDQFEWYVEENKRRSWPTFQTRLNITIPTPGWIKANTIVCSGQIPRVDMIPAGGYAAWLFRKKEPDGWFNELRMPLIQDVLSKSVLGVRPDQVYVGIYCFEEQYVDQRQYSVDEIANAYTEFYDLLKALGYSGSDETIN